MRRREQRTPVGLWPSVEKSHLVRLFQEKDGFPLLAPPKPHRQETQEAITQSPATWIFESIANRTYEVQSAEAGPAAEAEPKNIVLPDGLHLLFVNQRRRGF